MNCEKTNDCPCPKKGICENHGKCCACINFHLRAGDADYLPYCLFPDSDKSKVNLYRKLKEQFEN